MHPLTAFTWPALLLTALPSVVLGMDLGDKELSSPQEYCDLVTAAIRGGGALQLHNLFQHNYPYDAPRIVLSILINGGDKYGRLDVVQYALCVNKTAIEPANTMDFPGNLMLHTLNGHYGAVKLLMCYPALSCDRIREIINGCMRIAFLDGSSEEVAKHPARHEFVEFCTAWTPLIVECRDGETGLLDACDPDQLDDEMVDLLLVATFLGCQRHVTRKLAALLLGKYASYDMPMLKVAHEAAVENGLIHVASFLRVLGRTRIPAKVFAAGVLGTPELATNMHDNDDVITSFTKLHHQLYEEWHGGPHQKDVGQPTASVEDEEHP